MTTETITDYETVEKEKEITRCDGPGCTHTDEDVTLVNVCINPKVESIEKERTIPIQIFDDVHDRDAALRKKQARLREERETKDIIELSRQQDISPALGRKEEVVVENVKSSAKVDLCQNCISEFFNVDVEGDIEDIEIDDGEVKVIENVENVRSISTDFSSFPVWVYLLCILIWPATLLSFALADGPDQKNISKMNKYEIDKTWKEEVNTFIRIIFFGNIFWLFCAIIYLQI
jgi:hypothetical protein